MSRILFTVILLGVFSGGCSEHMSSIEKTGQKAKQEHLGEKELLAATDALKRIEIFVKENPSCEERQFLTPNLSWPVSSRDFSVYDSEMLSFDYNTIKRLAQETTSQRIREIQASAAKNIILNYHLSQDVPDIYNDLEDLAIVMENSDVIKQCWVDSIEGIIEFYYFGEEYNSVEHQVLNKKLKKWAKEKDDELFYKAYAQSLYYNFCNSSILKEYDGDFVLSQMKESLDRFRQAITELNRTNLKIYEAKGLNEYLRSYFWHSEPNPKEASIYCEEIIELARYEKDNIEMQSIQLEAIDIMLTMRLFTGKKSDLFKDYYHKLEELAMSFGNKPKFEILRAKSLAILISYSIDNIEQVENLRHQFENHILQHNDSYLNKLYAKTLCDTVFHYYCICDVEKAAKFYNELKMFVGQCWPEEDFYIYQARALYYLHSKSGCPSIPNKDFWDIYGEFSKLPEEYAQIISERQCVDDEKALWKTWAYGVSQLILESGSSRDFEKAELLYEKLISKTKTLPHDDEIKLYTVQAASSLSITYAAVKDMSNAKRYMEVVSKMADDSANLSIHKNLWAIDKLTSLYYSYRMGEIDKAKSIYEELKKADGIDFDIQYKAENLIEKNRWYWYTQGLYRQSWASDT